MERYYPVAAVTLLCCVMLFGMALSVARAHARTGIPAPAMTGHPSLERAVRAHGNTLEWLPIFLLSMWLFAIYWSPAWAAGIGLVWIAARIVYFAGYLADPLKRYPGFLVPVVVTRVLLFGALGRGRDLWRG